MAHEQNDSIKKHYEGCTTSIETRTQPGLFFTPRTHNNKTRDRLKETKERYEKKLQVHMDKYNVEAMMDKEYLKRDASMASLPSAGGQESSSQTKKEGDADMMTDVTEKVVEPVKAEDDPTTEQTQKDHEHAEKSASEAGNDKVEKKDDEPQKDEASPRGDDDSTTQKEEARPQEDKSEPMESSMEEE